MREKKIEGAERISRYYQKSAFTLGVLIPLPPKVLHLLLFVFPNVSHRYLYSKCDMHRYVSLHLATEMYPR